MKVTTPFRWFVPALGLLLGGYLFFSKSFAYLHVPGTPLFAGELVLLLGIAEAVRLRPSWIAIVRSSPVLKALLVFMVLCSGRLVVDLPEHGFDAVRDAAIWYYGAYAFLLVVAAQYDRSVVPRLLGWYQRVLPWFLVWAPIAVMLAEMNPLPSVTVPDSAAPITSFRASDFAVQVGLAIAFLWLGLHRLTGEPRRPRRELALSVLGVLDLMVIGTQNRGGFVAAVLLLAALCLLPGTGHRRILLPLTACVLVLVTIVALLGLHVPGQRRDVSVEQVIANATSIVVRDDAELSGTVEWRERLWEQVMDDLLGSSAWITGLGFGILLPPRYDIPLESPDDPAPLRNVHNSHLTIIARVGFVVAGFWALLWLTWGLQLVRLVHQRGGPRRDPLAALATWVGGGTAAALVNAYFDPALEGPHAAIWLFTLVGIGAVLTRRRRRGRGPSDPAGARR